MSSPYDLTSLASVKAWLNITNSNDDAVLGPLITAVSRQIQSYLSRNVIVPRAIVERFDGLGNDRIYLRNWPVLSVSQLLIDNRAILASQAPGAGVAQNAGYLLSPWDGMPPGAPQELDLIGYWNSFSRYDFARGRQNIQVSYLAGYAVQNEAQSVPSTPGPYTIVADQPWGPWASDEGVSYANGAALISVNGTPLVGQYSVSGGTYTFSASDAGNAVLISYGFIPQDIAQSCMELVSKRFRYKDRIGQTSKSIGGQETVSYGLVTKSLPPAIALMLQPYRSVLVI